MTRYLQCTGEEWDKARMRTLVRDNFECQAAKLGLPDCEDCSAQTPQGRLRKLSVHHKQLRVHGGTHDLENLLTVCYEHHIMIHPHMRFELAEGENKGFDLPLREI